MRELLVVKLKEARQNYITIYTTDYTQSRKLALMCAGRECIEYRSRLHNLDTASE